MGPSERATTADHMPRYIVRRAASVPRDISAIRAHLIRSYRAFGDTYAEAAERASDRIRGALDYMRTFESRPHRGTMHPGQVEEIRHVTSEDFIFYFKINEKSAEVSIIAVFFGGEDHLRRIEQRLRH